jgi:hypothetical protein
VASGKGLLHFASAVHGSTSMAVGHRVRRVDSGDPRPDTRPMLTNATCGAPAASGGWISLVVI